MALVTKNEFTEVVNNTTAYLQNLLERVTALEEKVKELESKKPTRARKDNANDE